MKFLYGLVTPFFCTRCSVMMLKELYKKMKFLYGLVTPFLRPAQRYDDFKLIRMGYTGK